MRIGRHAATPTHAARKIGCSGVPSPTEIDIKIEAQSNKSNAQGQGYLKNRATGLYEQVAAYTPGHNQDVSVWFRGLTDIAKYVDTANDRIDIRLDMTAPSSGFTDFLDSRYDHVEVVVIDP